MGGECPECGSKDTHYIMMFPVGTFHCYSCGLDWMPGVPLEPFVKFGEDSFIEFDGAEAWVQLGRNFAPHIQFFIMMGERVCSVEMFWEGTSYMTRQMGALV